jgi:hypothetical protein
MSLLAPLFLAGALAAAVPLALHLLRRKTREPVSFPSLRFLGPQIIRDEQKHRLRRLLVLLLRCLIIGLIALAFARPFFGESSAREGRLTVFLVDNSFSMQAGDRWERLKRWALTEAALHPGDEAGIMVMQPSPAWLIEPGSDLERVRDTLLGLPAGYYATSYDRPLRFAAEVLSASPSREIRLVVLADEQQAGWERVNFSQPLAPGVKPIFAPPEPAPAKQAALARVQASASPRQLRLEVEARLFSPDRDQRMVHVFSGTTRLAGQTVELQRGTPSVMTFRVDLPEDVVFPLALRVEMEPDDLPVDDVRYAVVDPSQALPVMVAPAGEAFVKGAVNATFAHRTLPLRAIAPASGPWPEDALVVVEGGGMFQGDHWLRFQEHLNAGKNALVFVDGDPALMKWLTAAGVTPEPLRSGDWSLTDCDLENPLFESFTPQTLLPLLRVRFSRAWALGGGNLQAVAHWPDGSTALAETQIGNGRVLVCGFNPSREASDLAISPSFVPFLHRALASLAPPQNRLEGLVGESISLPPAEGRWLAEDGKILEEKVSGSLRASRPGIYQFQPAQGPARLFAVNVSPDESQLAPWPAPEDFARLVSNEPRPRSTATTFRPTEPAATQNLWWWLLAAVAVLFLAELRLANRTAR